MKGDFSRITFRPAKRFSAVLLQQGRVLLDADFNEQGVIVSHALRQRMRDLLGPHAGRANSLGELGFTLSAADGHVVIGHGRYYVDGLLAENLPPAPDTKDAIDPLLFDEQTGYPYPGTVAAADFQIGTPYFFYLDVWERPVTWFDDADIREVALGGPDTSMRIQVTWQVRAVKRPAGAAFVPEEWLAANLQRHSFGDPAAAGLRLPQIKAWVDPKDNPDDTPCVADPLGGYRGLENQLYRVEVHNDGSVPGVPLSFKWSRDNGSVVAAWTDLDGEDLIVDGVHDTARGFSAGQWVELTDEIAQLNAMPGVFVRLAKVDRNRLTMAPGSASGPLPDLATASRPIVRRWDQRGRQDIQLNSGGTISIEEDKPYALERGIQVRFRKPDAGAPIFSYRTGDYWLIPARTATADIEWPYHMETVDGEPRKVFDYAEPDGVEHVFAPLGIVTPKAGGAFDVEPLQRKIIQLWS